MWDSTEPQNLSASLFRFHTQTWGWYQSSHVLVTKCMRTLVKYCYHFAYIRAIERRCVCLLSTISVIYPVKDCECLRTDWISPIPPWLNYTERFNHSSCPVALMLISFSVYTLYTKTHTHTSTHPLHMQWNGAYLHFSHVHVHALTQLSVSLQHFSH